MPTFCTEGLSAIILRHFDQNPPYPPNSQYYSGIRSSPTARQRTPTKIYSLPRKNQHLNMSFSSLMQDLSFKDSASERRQAARGASSTSTSTIDDSRSHISRARSYASTTATTVSISGDISSQLHGGYCHPLARSWQAERQLTKVKNF